MLAFVDHADSESEIDLIGDSHSESEIDLLGGAEEPEYAGAIELDVAPVLQQRDPKRKFHNGRRVDGQRVRWSKAAGPMSRGECISRAREARAKRTREHLVETSLYDCATLTDTVASQTKVRVRSVSRLNVPKSCKHRSAFLNAMQRRINDRLGPQHTKGVSGRQAAQIAFTGKTTRNSLARTWKVSATTVRRITEAVAYVYLFLQELLVIHVLSMLERCPPDFAVCSPMLDETGQKVQMGSARRV